MSTFALFIKAQDVKDTGHLESNVDDTLLRECILSAQREHIVFFIGSGLYDELDTQITAGTTTALNQTLLEKMKRAVIFWTLATGSEHLQYRMRGKGIQVMQDEKARAAELAEIDRLVSKFKAKAEMETDRLVNYLEQNSSSYPLYSNPGSGTDVIHPKHNNIFTSTIFLGGMSKGYRGIPSYSDREKNCGCDE